MKSSKLLGVVIVLQLMILLGQWTGQPSASTARADINLPNPSERQLAILDELKVMNGKFDKLLDVLQSGDVQVKMSNDAKK